MDNEVKRLEFLLEPDFSTTWLSDFVLAVARLNPSPAIRAVVLEDASRAPDLFKVSFLSVWQSIEISHLRDRIIFLFELLLTSPDTPPVTVDLVLSVLEFMDLSGSPLPVRVPLAAAAAERNELYAKAILFRELEYRESSGLPASDCVESLIAVNIKLGNLDCVHGLLRSSASSFVKVRPQWHEKLENYQAALSSYSVRLLEDPANVESQEGRMRCLSALGEWDRLLEVAGSSENGQAFRAVACYNSQRWDDLATALDKVGKKDFNSLVYGTVLAVRQGDLAEARRLVAEARPLVGPPMVTAPPPQNKRLYTRFLNQLQLTQLEEMIDYQSRPSAEALQALVGKWNQRLLDLDYSLEVWRRLIPLRAAVLAPADADIETWVRYSTLSRKKQNLTLSERIVATLAAKRPEYHGVVLARIKNDYAAGKLAAATSGLRRFLDTESLTSQCTSYLLSKCALAVGLWLPQTDPAAILYVEKAVRFDPSSFKAWSTLASNKTKSGEISEAVAALVKAIGLCSAHQAPLPDVLRLLTLWFNYYGTEEELDLLFEMKLD